jgi:hypothetical protein
MCSDIASIGSASQAISRPASAAWRRAGVDLLAGIPGLAAAQTGGRYRCTVNHTRLPARTQHRPVVAGELSIRCLADSIR